MHEEVRLNQSTTRVRPSLAGRALTVRRKKSSRTHALPTSIGRSCSATTVWKSWKDANLSRLVTCPNRAGGATFEAIIARKSGERLASRGEASNETTASRHRVAEEHLSVFSHWHAAAKLGIAQSFRPPSFGGFPRQLRLRQCWWKVFPSMSGTSRNSRALLPPVLAKKLTVARAFGSQIVALTAEERQQILLALERSPGKLDDDLRLLNTPPELLATALSQLSGSACVSRTEPWSSKH